MSTTPPSQLPAHAALARTQGGTSSPASIYILGGYLEGATSTKTCLSTVYVVNLQTGVWSTVEAGMPKGFVVGGIEKFEQASSINTHIYIYDIASKTWSTRDVPQSNNWFTTARIFHTAEFVAPSSLYLVCGLRANGTGSYLSNTVPLTDIVSIDLRTPVSEPALRTTVLTQGEHRARAYHSSAVVNLSSGPALFVYGGYNPLTNEVLDYWLMWDVRPGRSQLLGPSNANFVPGIAWPGQRYLASMVAVGSKAYLFGGADRAGANDVLRTENMWVMDASSNGKYVWKNSSKA
ncbi:hypothetical protein HK104_011168, partial [Borealophlyctis nickersoniae]